MNTEISALGVLSLLETTKEQRQSFVQSVVESLKEGNADPLQVHLQVKNTEDLVKQITEDKEYRKLCLEEAQKHGKSFDRFNAKFEVKEVGSKFDYSVCNDPVLARLQQAMEIAKKALKDREDWIKKAPSDGVPIIDEETGEAITVYPPIKTSTTSVAVSLK